MKQAEEDLRKAICEHLLEPILKEVERMLALPIIRRYMEREAQKPEAKQ